MFSSSHEYGRWNLGILKKRPASRFSISISSDSIFNLMLLCTFALCCESAYNLTTYAVVRFLEQSHTLSSRFDECAVLHYHPFPARPSRGFGRHDRRAEAELHHVISPSS